MRYDTKEKIAFVMREANCDKTTAKVWLKYNKGNMVQAVLDARFDVQMREVNRNSFANKGSILDSIKND